jgi:hemoglobin-like flavoprotein
MNNETISVLRTSFDRIAARKADVATIFYERLFQVAPSVRPMFKNDLLGQQQKLMTSLVQIVQWVDQPDQLTRYLTNMGSRHVGYGAQPEHYDAVGSVLLWTFEQVLGTDFTPEVRQAWTEAYGAVSQLMQQGAATARVA